MNGVDPQAWLADVLSRIATHPAHRLISCCRGTGRREYQLFPLRLPDHACQQGHHVTTINRVAKDLGETRTGYSTSPTKWTSEDGVIWVYGVGDDGVMAFTDFGIENLIDLIKLYKDDRRYSSAGTATNSHPAAYAGWILRKPQDTAPSTDLKRKQHRDCR